MRISTEAVNEARQSAEHRVDEQKTSDRFSQLLKSKNEKSQAENKGNGGDAQQKDLYGTIDLQSVNSPGTDASVSRTSISPTTADPGKIAQPGGSAPHQIEKLTIEMGHQIDIFKQGGKAEAVNITFDSKTLEGLQVQIRQQDGELAIRFVTQSEKVSELLSHHTGELREALTSKGVKIGNITISAHATPLTRRNGHAGA